MDNVVKSGSPRPRTLIEALTRMLRHEIGDLLQTIYATVAILQKRLDPDLTLEQRILGDLRKRGETCKHLLDAVHDFVCPVALQAGPVDVADLAANLVRAASQRYPQLEIVAESKGPVPIEGDERRLAQTGEQILTNACEAAQKQVRFRTTPGPGDDEVEWDITDDGPGVAASERERLFTPFYTTRHGHVGLGLALAKKLVQLHGGQILAENGAGGGFRVRVLLPRVPRPAETAEVI